MRKRTPEPPLLNGALLQAGDRVLSAVSGGADSLALLYLLATHREALGIEVVAAHVHHGMRGEQADADVKFLGELCAELSVPFAVSHADVPALAREPGVSVEEAGRLARYEAFAELAAEHRCNKVALAHHADDQVETVLLSLIRGGGLDGLAGIPERRPLFSSPDAPEVVRPLLHRTRAELQAYCAAHRLQPRHDATNDDPRYRRNRLRAEVLPLLEQMEPRIRQHLLRVSRLATEDRDALHAAWEAVLDDLDYRAGDDVRLPLPLLQSLPPALRRRALKWLIETAGASPTGELVEAALALVERGGGPALTLPGGRRRVCLRDRMLVGEVMPEPSNAPEGAAALAVGETVEIPWRPGEFVAAEVLEPPQPVAPGLDVAYLDLDCIAPPLLLRPPRRGDRFRPLGAPGSRLVSDLLRDRRVPPRQRAQVVVVEDAEGILWVEGGAIADRARLQPNSRGCLHLALRRGTSPCGEAP